MTPFRISQFPRFAAYVLLLMGILASTANWSPGPVLLVNGAVLCAFDIWQHISPDSRARIGGITCGLLALLFGLFTILALYIAVQMIILPGSGEQARLIMLGFGTAFGLVTWLCARWCRYLLPHL